MKSRLTGCLAGFLLAHSVSAQILMSGGTYSQNFDSLASNGTGIGWTNNITLTGWYLAKSGTNATSYASSTGSDNTGGFYSFGVAGANTLSDRALGSLASSSAKPIVYGVRFTNDTGLTVTNITVGFTGEQWRNGGSGSASMLAFYYATSSQPITNGIDAAAWTSFSALNFTTPTVSTFASALDGNSATNRQVFVGVILTNVVVFAGQELFLRWLDADDGGSDSALAIDDLIVTFQSGANTTVAPVVTLQPQSQTVDAGADVTFSIAATGTPTPVFQWKFNGTNLVGETNAVLALSNVSTNQAGGYYATVSNLAGSTNSQIATLTVKAITPPPVVTNATITLMTYNVKGNGTTDWSTNASQVQSIGREIVYLNPDVITFNEIPYTNTWQMTNWVTAFMPGYYLAMNSGTDGSIRSVIASRFPINRSQKWLDGADLNPFGYTNSNFTRDLFEAELAVPGWPQPLHVFTTHLKATSGTTYTDAAAKRAAEAAAITNFIATNMLALHPLHPFTLSGDMNEADTNQLSIQRLISEATTLRLTNPKNPVSGSIYTYDSASPNGRIDYIFPCTLLFSNIAGSQVFRTDTLAPLPASLLKFDSTNASDHLPVLMTFANPFAQPFRVTDFAYTHTTVTLQWQAVPGGVYRLEDSTNLTEWTAVATNLLMTNYTGRLSTNSSAPAKFFRLRTQ